MHSMTQMQSMIKSTSTLSINVISMTHTLYCVNCNRKLLDDLSGISFSLRLKCPRCKAKFVINKTNQ